MKIYSPVPECVQSSLRKMKGAASYERERCNSSGNVIKDYTLENTETSICANCGDSVVTRCDSE